ncbi:MAG: pyridoxal-dependent decarboxylase [Spirochaetota bacterium]
MTKNVFLKQNSDIDSLREKLALVLNTYKERGGFSRSNASPEDLSQMLQEMPLFPEKGIDFAEQGKILETTIEHAIHVNHPHTVAHLHCPPLQDAIAGDLLASILNLSMDSWDQSGVATILEQHVLAELCSAVYGQEQKASAGIFTDGGTRSNLMGVLFAREVWMQQETGQSAFQKGFSTSNQNAPVILCSENAHFSAEQAAALLGLGREAVFTVPVDERGSLIIAKLHETYAELQKQSRKVLCVFATAGTTDRGCIDPLGQIADFCQEQGIWMHVDAAVAACLVFTKWKDRLKGIERADSVTMDFHKLFFQPIACGAFLLRNREDFHRIKINAEYLNREEDNEPNLVDFSLSTTRRFDVLKLFLSMRGLGRKGYESLLERLSEQVTHVSKVIEDSKQLHLVAEPQLFMVLFEFRNEAISEKEQSKINVAIRRHLLREGKAIVGQTSFQGRNILKFTLMNPETSDEELSHLLVEIEKAAEKIRKETMTETKNQFAYQAFLNCYLREIDNWELKLVKDDSDCPESFKSSSVRSYIEINLQNMQKQIVVGIKYWSLTRRHQFIFPVYRKDKQQWLALTMEDMARLGLQEMAEEKHATKSAEPDVLLAKLKNSSENIERFINERLSEIPHLNRAGSLSFIETEQALLIGHQMHPSGKCREGLAGDELAKYSPELKGEFSLRYFRLDPSIAHHDSAVYKSAPDLIHEMLEKDPLISPAFREKLTEKPGAVILPVHPWQANFALNLPEVKELISKGLLEDLGEAGSPFTPTTSIRTVYRDGFDFMFKFSLNIKITNSVRVNKHWELDRSLEMARLMQTDYGKTIQGDVPNFHFIQDPAYLSVKYEGKVIESLSCLFREAESVGNGRDITSITSLVQDNPAGGKNRLYNIIAAIAEREGRELGETALEWYRSYLQVSIYALLKLYFKWGLCFEAHGQNSLLELKDGKPYLYLYRDSQGYFHRAAAHDDFCKVIPKLGEKTESVFPEDLANERLVYYLIVNQVFSVINAFGTQGLADEKILMQEFRETLDRVAQDGARYPTTMVEQLKSLSRLPCKGNLLTQLFNMDELVGDIATQSVYVTLPNVIKEPV